MEDGVDVEEAVLESTKKQVLLEMEAWAKGDVEKTGRNWESLTQVERDRYFYGHMTNFIGLLPDSSFPEGRSDAVAARRNPSHLTTINREAFEEHYRQTPKPQLKGVDWDAMHEEEMSEYSDRFLGQTPKQFYEIIDKAIEKEGYLPGEVARWQAEGVDYIELRKKMLPVYVRLRAFGYTRMDLGNV